MRALVYEGPMRLRLAEVPEPAPEPGEVLVEIEAAGICGSDIHAIAGETGRRQPGMILGHEAAGVVVALGGGAQSLPGGDGRPLRVGDRVAIQPIMFCGQCPACRAGATQLCAQRRIVGVNVMDRGTLAERVRVPAQNAYRLEAEVPAELGALIEPFAVALHAARRAAVGPGQRVAVLGAGTIGLCALLAARQLGAAQVWITDLLPEKLALAQQLGGLPLRAEGAQGAPSADPVAAVREATGGQGVDVALDAVGTSQTLAHALGMVRPGGVVVVIGLHRPQVQMPLYELVTVERQLMGSYAYSAAHFGEAVDLVRRGAIPLAPLIQERRPLAEAIPLILALCRGESQIVKGLVLPQATA